MLRNTNKSRYNLSVLEVFCQYIAKKWNYSYVLERVGTLCLIFYVCSVMQGFLLKSIVFVLLSVHVL